MTDVTTQTRRVVIADDAAELRHFVRVTLEQNGGFEVVAEAGDGATAVSLVQAHRPDVVVLDLSMPVMDGLQALAEIRRSLPDVPVVVLSAFNRGEMAPEALSLGAAAYIEKSTQLGRISETLADVCGLRPLPSTGDDGWSGGEASTEVLSTPATATPEAPVDAPAPSSAVSPRRGLASTATVALDATLRRLRVSPVSAGVAVAVLLLAAGLIATQSSARRVLRDSVLERSQLGADLIAADIAREAVRVQRSAETALGGSDLTPETVVAVGTAVGSPDLHIVLAGDGTVAHITPSQPALIGQDIRDRFEHLAGASAGTVTVSNMVRGVVDGRPLAALAVPFRGVDGTRAFSMVIDPEQRGYDGIARTALGSVGARTYLVDENGALVVPHGSALSLTPLADVSPRVADFVTSGEEQDRSDGRTYSQASIAGTPWTLVSVVDDLVLYAPVEGWLSTLPWMIIALAVGLAVVVHGLTARLRREAARLTVVNAELERSNRDLEQFAYVASHDLQEPLRKVASYCQLLQRRYAGRLDADADQFIEYAVDGASRLQQLIADLLEYSRAGRDLDMSSMGTVDLHRIAGDVQSTLQTRAEQAGGRVVVVGQMPSVIGESTALRQILQNLVTNGLKFQREGVPPVVTIRSELVDGKVVVEVSDNGIGIDPDHVDRVFGVFQRLHTREEFEGTGIGLAIVRRLVIRHGGDITAAPRADGDGTTFTFTLTPTP